jgi:hypothetical protein
MEYKNQLEQIPIEEIQNFLRESKLNGKLDIFTSWKKWEDRDIIENVNYPGVYIIAKSKIDISSKEFSWIEDIIYIGYTNCKNGGLKTRLKQFDNTIKGKTGHGGAERVRYKYNDYNKLKNELYVSVKFFKCDVKSDKPEDLIIMGESREFEEISIARYVKNHGRLPEFNDMKKSKKK